MQEDDEPDDETTPLRSDPPRNDESVRNRSVLVLHFLLQKESMKNHDSIIIPMILTGNFLFRDVPSSAALPIIRPALLRQHSMSDRAKVAMQGYLNHFLGNLDIVNSREVCLFSCIC